MARQIFFWATHNDLVSVLQTVENTTKVKYYRAGLLDKDQITEYHTLIIDEVGIAVSGDNNQCRSYLILPADGELEIRDVPQRAGGIKYAIDQQKNKSSVYFRPCGSYEERQAIIEGRLDTISDSKISIDIFNFFSKAFKSSFTKVKGALIGNEALALYNAGWRLTQNINSPKEYDLRLTNEM